LSSPHFAPTVIPSTAAIAVNIDKDISVLEAENGEHICWSN
jgi:hypothetical protein